MPDTKDFRRALLVKVGLDKHDKSETKKILEEQILKETYIDLNKLVHFALKYHIPSEHRLHCWKLLLDCIPTISGAQKLVWTEQKEQSLILYRGLVTMRKTSNFKRRSITNEQQPAPEDVLRMTLLENASLEIDDDKQVSKAIHGRLLSLSERVISICRLTLQEHDPPVKFEDLLAESYWISKGLNAFIKQHDINNALAKSLLNELKCELRFRNGSVYDLLDTEDMWNNLPIKKWFSCAFSQVLCPQALCLLWDKMLTGCMSILVYVAIELFDCVHKKVNKTECKDGVSQTDVVLTNLLHYASDVAVSEQETLVKRAIDIWTNRGSCAVAKKK